VWYFFSARVQWKVVTATATATATATVHLLLPLCVFVFLPTVSTIPPAASREVITLAQNLTLESSSKFVSTVQLKPKSGKSGRIGCVFARLSRVISLLDQKVLRTKILERGGAHVLPDALQLQ
jgi:hypothetical protein